MNSLQDFWAKALKEYQEFAATGPSSKEPEELFCQGYIFGVAFGLALSTVRPDLVPAFAERFRRRGWLQDHEPHHGNGKS